MPPQMSPTDPAVLTVLVDSDGVCCTPTQPQSWQTGNIGRSGRELWKQACETADKSVAAYYPDRLKWLSTKFREFGVITVRDATKMPCLQQLARAVATGLHRSSDPVFCLRFSFRGFGTRRRTCSNVSTRNPKGPSWKHQFTSSSYGTTWACSSRANEECQCNCSCIWHSGDCARIKL